MGRPLRLADLPPNGPPSAGAIETASVSRRAPARRSVRVKPCISLSEKESLTAALCRRQLSCLATGPFREGVNRARRLSRAAAHRTPIRGSRPDPGERPPVERRFVDGETWPNRLERRRLPDPGPALAILRVVRIRAPACVSIDARLFSPKNAALFAIELPLGLVAEGKPPSCDPLTSSYRSPELRTPPRMATLGRRRGTVGSPGESFVEIEGSRI